MGVRSPRRGDPRGGETGERAAPKRAAADSRTPEAPAADEGPPGLSSARRHVPDLDRGSSRGPAAGSDRLRHCCPQPAGQWDRDFRRFAETWK